MTLNVKAGDIIFKQDDSQRTMFNIQEGKVAIMIDYGKPSEKQLVELEAGQFFGEMSLLESQPRSATAIAMTDGALEVVDENSFNDYVQSNPDFAMKLLKYFSSRLRAITGDYQEACRTIAQVYDLEDVKKAVKKADEGQKEEKNEEKTETKEKESGKKKGFLSRSIEKFVEVYNSDEMKEIMKYQYYYQI